MKTAENYSGSWAPGNFRSKSTVDHNAYCSGFASDIIESESMPIPATLSAEPARFTDVESFEFAFVRPQSARIFLRPEVGEETPALFAAQRDCQEYAEDEEEEDEEDWDDEDEDEEEDEYYDDDEDEEEDEEEDDDDEDEDYDYDDEDDEDEEEDDIES